MMNEMFHEGTRVILHEDDLNSMRYSIENRSPYLDSKLFEVSYSIPTEHLIRDGYGKYILREAVKGILNDQVRLDRQKKGFNATITSLVNFKDPSIRDYILSDSPVYDLVDRKKIEAVIPAESLPNSMSKFWFYFLNAKVFLEQNR
jgi:asparagine synthase (glutamine-hydrolysing)